MKKLRVIMISFAHSHAYSYFESLKNNAQVEVIAIADESFDRVKSITETNQIPYYADYKQALAVDADAVVICSENSKHEEHVLASAQAGKHVLCEKPLGISIQAMQNMIEACKTAGVQLMTAFPCRYLPAVIQAKKSVERGDIGEIIVMNGTNRGTMPGGWFIDKASSGGGAVFDHTVHVMDLMHWFTGAKVTDVYAHAETLFHNIDIDDAGMLHATFDNGAVATLDPSWSRSKSFPTWGDVTLEIIGTKGVIQVDALHSFNEVYADEETKAMWSYYGDNMDQGLIDDFVDAILTGRNVSITGTDGFNAASVALAAYESAAKGEVVKLQI